MPRPRLIGGLLNKARRGGLWVRPPTGYVYDESQKFVFEPDEQIQGAVRLLFETFHRTGSAEQVVKHFSKYSTPWPCRLFEGKRNGTMDYRKLLMIQRPGMQIGASQANSFGIAQGADTRQCLSSHTRPPFVTEGERILLASGVAVCNHQIGSYKI